MGGPGPSRCSTAAKISGVAAAMRVAISHSSKWWSARLSTLNTLSPPVSDRTGRECDHSQPFCCCCYAKGRPSVHLDVEFLGDQVEHLLPDAALGPCIGRLHRLLPGLALIIGQIVQRYLARLLDLGEGILILLDRDRVGLVRRLVHRLVALFTEFGR